MKLTNSDYVSILKYYNINIDNLNDNSIKKKAEYILANKMCRCIKSVQKKSNYKLNEQNAIALCRKSVLKNKNINIFNFSCKKKAKLYPQKNGLSKTIKITKFKPQLKLYTPKRLRQLKDNKRTQKKINKKNN